MIFVTALEAKFKTLDEENPIDVVVEDVILELEKLARKYYGEKTIVTYEGNYPIDGPQHKHRFTVRTRNPDRSWRGIVIVNMFSVWKQAPGSKFHVLDITEE